MPAQERAWNPRSWQIGRSNSFMDLNTRTRMIPGAFIQVRQQRPSHSALLAGVNVASIYATCRIVLLLFVLACLRTWKSWLRVPTAARNETGETNICKNVGLIDWLCFRHVLKSVLNQTFCSRIISSLTVFLVLPPVRNFASAVWILFLCLCGLPDVANAQGVCGVSVGSVVEIANTGTSGIRVRSCAGTSCTPVKTNFDGTIGTVQSGPTSANGYTWWQIRWNDGNCTLGYSAEGDGAGKCYLQAVSPYTASLLSPAASASVTFPQTFSWSSSCALRLAFATSANPSTVYYLALNLNSLYVSAADWSSAKSTIGTASTYYWTVGEVIGSYFYARAPYRLFTEVVFRFTIIWESMIVIIRENRAEVIEIIWERVEPRAA
jgi:hypothetical protein